MKTVAEMTDKIVAALETRRGRLAFWTIVIVAGIGMGVTSVIRAEVPRKVTGEYKALDPWQAVHETEHGVEFSSSEFRGFRAISWATIVQGKDQYADIEHIRAYPPFFAIAFFPFAVPWRIIGVGSALFFLIGYGGSLLSAWWMARWHRGRGEPTPFGLFALIWLLMAPFTGAVLARCESDMLVILPVAAAFMLMARSEKPMLAGGLLGFAVSLKILPGLFGLYLICQRRWRALGGMVAVGLVCTVLLPCLVWGPRSAWERHVSWYDHVIAPYGSGGATGVIGRPYRSTNQSLTAAVYRFFTDTRAGKSGDHRQVNIATLSGKSAHLIATVLHGISGLGLVALWIACRRKQEAPAARAVVFATVPLGVLLLSDVSLTTHHITIMVACATILGRAVGLREEGSRRTLRLVAAAMIVCAVGALPTVRLFSPFLAATVILLVACVQIALRDRSPDDTSHHHDTMNTTPATAEPDEHGQQLQTC